MMQIKKLIIKLIKGFFKGFFLILLSILLAICMRVFLFASFKVPTNSMEPAIVPGDFVFVNKLLIGPRIFQSLDYLKGMKTPVKRLRGFRKIRRNDVLVFNFPYSNGKVIDLDLNVFYVKRCVAIPGDTFYIDNGIYKVSHFPDSLGSYASQQQYANLAKEDMERWVWYCFPYDSVHFRWTNKDFGPFYVPGKGDTLKIDTNSIKLYRSLIRYETEKEIRVRGDSVFLEDELLRRYAFTKNYYFMSGDRVIDSEDSRYWGLLSEDHIVGKAAFIWKSVDTQTGQYRWDRFLKRI